MITQIRREPNESLIRSLKNCIASLPSVQAAANLESYHERIATRLQDDLSCLLPTESNNATDDHEEIRLLATDQPHDINIVLL